MRASLFFSFWALPPLGLGLFWLSRWWQPGYPLSRLLVWIPLGILLWTLLEYLLHRFLFHWRPRNRRLRQIIAELHLVHHADTHNPEQILVRPRFSLPISAFLLAVFAWIGGINMGVELLLGIWIGFLTYETVHYRVHMSKRSQGLLQYQRRCHFIHHFIDQRSCFGVTTPFWDILLGTFRKLEDPTPESQP